MGIVKIVLEVIFVILCIAITVVVLAQEGKSSGLSALGGGVADTFWNKNKGRTIEGKLEKSTKYMAILFFVLSIVLSLSIFA